MTGIWRSTPQTRSFYKWTQVDLRTDVQEGSGLREGVPHQLVPVLQDRPCQRGSGQRLLRALRHPGYEEESPSVDAPYHELRRTSAERSGQTGLAGEGEEDAATGSAKSYGAEVDFPVEGTRGEDHRVYHQTGYPSRCHLHGTGSGACAGKEPGYR